jgi:phage shock protein PspC (stress-responsive transcriptional regulator)
MRKTITITIGQSIFHIEEQAFDTLDIYLRSIRDHFASYDDHEEIVSDIESRMAEEFTEQLKEKKRAAISDSDVAELMKRMGTVEDFAAFEGETHQQSTEEKKAASKRLYRDPENQVIAGVASGIANYFQIDPIIVRLLFVASLFFGGAGILIYIVLWIVMPEAKTPSERAEMQGKPITLKRIEETIREAVPAATKNIKPGTLGRIVRFPFMILRKIFTFIGRLLKAIIPILGRILGFLLLLGTVAALLFLTFWFVMFMTGGWEQYMDVPVRQLAGNVTYYVTLITGYIVAFTPLVMVLGIGVSLVQMKNAFRFNTVMILLGVWMVALTAGAVTVAREVPAFHAKISDFIEEQEVETAQDILINGFQSIDVAGPYNVTIHNGDGYAMTVRGSNRALERLQSWVNDDGTLMIRRHNSNNSFCIICLGNSVTIDITVPDTLENVTAHAGTSIDIDDIVVQGNRMLASGGSSITITDIASERLSVEASAGSRIDVISMNPITELSIEASAGSRISYAGEAQSTVVEAYAGSRVTLEGSGSTLNAELAAGSELNAATFPVRDATVEAYAGGSAEVDVSGTLSGSASAGGSIRYAGNPMAITIEEHSSGHVSPLESDDHDFDIEEMEELEEPSF